MLGVLIAATAVVILIAVYQACVATRDPLHPLIPFGCLAFYMYVLRPAVLYVNDGYPPYFTDQQPLLMAQLINLLGVLMFAVGAMRVGRMGRGNCHSRQTPFTGRDQLRIVRIALLLGCVGLLAEVIKIANVGGFAEAYAHAKGGGRTATGYLNEAPLLVYPAIGLLLLAWRSQRLRPSKIALLLFLASPEILQAILGSRRGAGFRVVIILLLGRYVMSRRRPSFRYVVAAVLVAGVTLVFIHAHRPQLYLGSHVEIDRRRFFDTMFPQVADGGEETTVSAAWTQMAREHGRHRWGMTFVAHHLIRPIPKQLWPTKYEDIGIVHTDAAYLGPYRLSEWQATVGWIPEGGHAIGFAVDLFVEFSWLGLLGCLLAGMGYGWLWKRMKTLGGFWNLVYLLSVALIVYLPTQSVSAITVRLLFMCIPAYLLWRLFVRPCTPIERCAPIPAVTRERISARAMQSPKVSGTHPGSCSQSVPNNGLEVS